MAAQGKVWSLGETYQTEVRPMLNLVNDLERTLAGHGAKVELPRIVVVGNQSSGKSSVLERLSTVGLPRNTGLCTRVPLRLILKFAETGPVASIRHWGVNWSDVPLDNISKAVLQLTEKLAGSSKDIGEKFIELRVEGPTLSDLTLVDLPGLVYSPVGGQPENLHEKVRKLILKYIEPEATLVMCVFAGDEDLATSEALQLAREVDPKGKRTLGVITKLDLVTDKSTLRNKIMQLADDNMGINLGLVAVRNRNFDELRVGVSLEKVAHSEQQLVDNMEELTDVPKQQYLGIPALIRKLCGLQLDHLQRMLPGIDERMRREVSLAEERLGQIRGCSTPAESFNELQRELDRMKLVLRSVVNGDYQVVDDMARCTIQMVPDVDRLLFKFADKLAQLKPKVFEEACVADAQKALAGTDGLALPNFLSHEAFRSLMRKWQEPYEKVTHEALDGATTLVRSALEKVANVIQQPDLRRFLVKRLQVALDTQYKQAREQLDLRLKMESRVVYTVNNSYIATLRKLQAHSNWRTQTDAQPDTQELAHERQLLVALLDDGDHRDDEAVDTMLTEIAKRSLSHDAEAQKLLELQMSAFCYDRVVRKRLSDGVMQVVRYFYIEHAANELGLQLGEGLTQEQAHSLLRAGVEQEEERARLQGQVAACRRCISRIEETGQLGQVPLGRQALEGEPEINDVQLPDWARSRPEDHYERSHGRIRGGNYWRDPKKKRRH